jgi:hypothetical protein
VARRHGIQHKTTGYYLEFRPDIGPVSYVGDPLEACTLPSHDEAEVLRADLLDFADAHEVVELEIPMASDKHPGEADTDDETPL